MTEQIVELDAKVQWMFYKEPQSHRWIGLCKALKLCLEADTVTELREDIDEAMNLLLRNLLEDNELEAFLKAHGWSTRVDHQHLKGAQVGFDVPFELVQMAANDPKRLSYQ